MLHRISLTDLAVRRPIDTPADVALHFGVTAERRAETPGGLLPFAIRRALLRTDRYSGGAFTARPFTAGGTTFFWLDRPGDERAWRAIDVRGHRLVEYSEERIDMLRAAVEVIATRPGAMELVRCFITTFAFVERLRDGTEERQLTSCSLPDLPLAVFVSDHASVHIPPLTVAERPSVRHLAENIYHEAVHQYVNYRLLTEDLFIAGYDARTSPRVTIPWRANGADRNRSWELDRVLHAAAVYVQVAGWRYDELRSGTLTSHELDALEEASSAAVEASLFLNGALTEHVHFFTPAGALFVGRLTRAAEEKAWQITQLLSPAVKSSLGSVHGAD